ncbi:hypothetical protein BFL40_12565 [Pseudomonas costantinii]|nr:hypothetical protein BFL40_12565 [Pseudomonas costantinii]
MVDTNYWTLAEVNYRRDEYLANAKLIAAAPELLIALRLALDALAHCAADKGYQSLQNKAAHAANSAIAKATQ